MLKASELTPILSPQKVHLHTQSNRLDIYWQNGEIDQLSGALLRQYCACSTCRAKGHVGVQIITDNNTIKFIKPMGTTGIQIAFADGHDRGVYPWGYLSAIAQGEALAFLDNN